jgi:hypothetical protein
MNSQMAIITNILPIGFGLFSLQFPAGLVLYFLVSNLWRLGQQEIIMHKITRPGQAAIAAAAGGAIDVKSAETETSAFPKAAGGLRKLFQLPAANGGGSGEANGDSSESTGTNGTTKPKAGQPSGGAKASGTKPGGPGKGSTGGAQARGSGSGGSGSSARRRNSKKRKRR